MRKFIIMIAAALLSLAAAAQTVESSKLFENTYVTVGGGIITTTHTGGQPFFWDGAKNIVNGIRPVAGIEFGKYVTPVVGFSVEGLAMFNTTESTTLIDQSNVVGNLKLNLSNWFGGYLGQPRRVEVVLAPGLGWGHDYGEYYEGIHRNYLTYNAGVELNVNLGKARAWQINVKPVAMWNNHYNDGVTESAFRPIVHNMQARLQVGVTYKFGSRSKKSHNFVLCPYSVTTDDYAQAKARIAELEARKPEVVEVVKTVTEVKKEVVKETRVLIGSNIITFAIGSSTLTPLEKAKVVAFAKSLEDDTIIQIVGSYDSKTGTEKRNESLATSRAEIVKKVLVSECGVDANRIQMSTTADATDNALTSRSAILTFTTE